MRIPRCLQASCSLVGLLGLLGLLPLSLLAGCSSSSVASSPVDAAADAGDVGAPAGSAGDGSDDAVSDAAPSRLRQAFEWILAAANGAPITEADVAARFSASFLTAIPASQVVAIFQQLAMLKPWAVVSSDETAASLGAVVTRSDGQYMRVSVVMDAGGLIAGLQFSPAGDLDPALRSWEAIDQAVAAQAPKVNLMAATLGDTGCTSLHGLGTDASLAIGSAFKLWVLAALANDVDAGHHAWTDTTTIVDAHKSLPSGELQDVPAGAALSLLTFANKMISISDNTAADHVLFLLGRDAVESTLAATGHHDPMLNQPFLGTRELFTLKLMLTPAERDAYLAVNVTGKRALLDQYDAAYDPRAYRGPAWVAPRNIDTLEWFATPGDLCNVMRALKAAADKPATAPVAGILSINPGLPDPTAAFAYIGYKGGSEPGVLNLTWLLQRKADNQWLFLTLGFNDTAHPIDEETAEYVAGAARELLGRP